MSYACLAQLNKREQEHTGFAGPSSWSLIITYLACLSQDSISSVYLPFGLGIANIDGDRRSCFNDSSASVSVSFSLSKYNGCSFSNCRWIGPWLGRSWGQCREICCRDRTKISIQSLSANGVAIYLRLLLFSIAPVGFVGLPGLANQSSCRRKSNSWALRARLHWTLVLRQSEVATSDPKRFKK